VTVEQIERLVKAVQQADSLSKESISSILIQAGLISKLDEQE